MVIRIAIVEDQRIMREAVAAVLERDADFALVGEAATASEAIELAMRERPDVLILDVSLLDGNGLDVARTVRECAPEVRIVALSAHTDAAHVHAMLEAGALAYIDKFSAFEELTRGIRSALQGMRYLSARLTEEAPAPKPSAPAVRDRQVVSTGEASLSRLVRGRRRLKGGQMLFNDGDPFGSLYRVSCGFFKCVVLDAGGRGQITGFFIPGDLVGLEGVGRARHGATAIALEDSEAAVLPYALIAARSREDRALQHLIHVAFSRDIGRKQSVMLLLGSMRAEERLAYFLLDLSSRYARRGYSPADLRLPMTREDIGSYLGLTVETVSRLFTRFQKQRIIDLRQRQLKLIDVAGLHRLAGAPGD